MSSDGPAHRVQSAVVEYGYPQGHLGHLSSDEEAAFKNFKIVCEEKGYYKPGTGDEPGTHDDATLLFEFPFALKYLSDMIYRRFLRARRFIVPDALNQFTDTEDWRKANQLDQLYETIDIEHYEETRHLVPSSPLLPNFPSNLPLVPTVDRPSRSPRNPSLRLRSQAPKQQNHGRVREIRQRDQLKSANGRQDLPQTPPPLRTLRELNKIRDALVHGVDG